MGLSSARSSWGEQVFVVFAKLFLLHLAHRVARQFGHYDQFLWVLEPRERGSDVLLDRVEV